MKWPLAAALTGLTGCTWIIGDIPVPDDLSVDADAIAGAWYVYGLSDRRAISDRITIAGDGAVQLDDQTTQAELDDDGLWSLDLGEGIGRVSGRFAPESGIGLMVEASPGDPAVFVTLIREPSVRGSLLGGRTVQLGLTEAGSPIAEFARLERNQDDVYRQSQRLTLTDEQLESRQVTVVPESDDAPRWVVRTTGDGDWLLSPLVSGDGAIGVGRSENGSPRGPTIVWRDPVSPDLPDRELFCAGLTVEDGVVASRARAARIQNDRIDWSDGRRGWPSTVAGAAVLEGDGSFYDDQGTLILPDTNGRLFALLPLVPDTAGSSPERSWGLALCIGLDAIDAPDPGVDAAPPMDGGVDATPADAASDGSPADSAAPDAAPDDALAPPRDAAMASDDATP